MKGSLSRVLLLPAVLATASVVLAACGSSGTSTPAASSSGSGSGSSSGALKTGLKVFVIPKNLGNPYFTTSDSVKSGGALAALQQLGETGSETSGTAATPASQIPAIQAAVAKGANALVVSASDPTALCPTLNAAIKKGITVVTYDSDAPTCRTLFVNQASTAQIGTSEVSLLASEIHSSGQIAILSATASAPNQNAWIGFMKQELTKYPKMKLVTTVYGNDDPTTRKMIEDILKMDVSDTDDEIRAEVDRLYARAERMESIVLVNLMFETIGSRSPAHSARSLPRRPGGPRPAAPVRSSDAGRIAPRSRTARRPPPRTTR